MGKPKAKVLHFPRVAVPKASQAHKDKRKTIFRRAKHKKPLCDTDDAS